MLTNTCHVLVASLKCVFDLICTYVSATETAHWEKLLIVAMVDVPN